MPKNMLLSAVLRGVLAGLIGLLVSALALAAALMFTSDPLQSSYAASLMCCMISGLLASAVAGKAKKEKPLWASLLAGLVLEVILLLVSLAAGDTDMGLVKCGVLAIGVMIGLLAVPALSRRKSKYRKLVNR